MEKHLLSKSTFIRGLQCHKSLYLYKKRNFLKDSISPEQLARFSRGTDVGVLARDLFPGGIDVSPKSPSQYLKSVEKTRELIQAGQEVIYEATFQYERVLIMLDILIKTDKGYKAIEVKSSKSLSETFYQDASLQYYIISNTDIHLTGFSLMHINTDYVSEAELDLASLFIETDVTDHVRANTAWIAEEIEKEKAVLELKNSPKIDIGLHCNIPYPCDFQGHCHKHIPKNSVLKLSDLSPKDRYALYDMGIVDIKDLKDQIPFTERQLIQIEAHRSEVDYIDAQGLANVITAMGRDITFLHILNIHPAVPVYENHHPYHCVPFMISIINKEGTAMQYLFDGTAENRISYLQNILDILLEKPNIVVFDSSKLMEALTAIATEIPERSKEIKKIESSISDLKDVFVDKRYYPYKLMGDYSFAGVCKIVNKTWKKQRIFLDVQAGQFFQQSIIDKKVNKKGIGIDDLKGYGEYAVNETKLLFENIKQLIL